jgi:hypothetical protein
MRWAFLNRRTGRITVAQWPNIPLAVFLLSTVASLLFQPQGGVEVAARAVADVSLIVWAADELLRGVNPFRRALGSTVLVATLIGLILSAR